MSTLLVVDLQNDFCPGGALEVPEGDSIVPIVNQLIGRFQTVILTQDWHPEGHKSFASSHPDKSPFETIEMPYGTQVLWPDHCVQGSKGAAFHSDLNTDQAQLIIRKGFRTEIDSYSAFFENDHSTSTGLHGYLKDLGLHDIYICGLASDFCVKWSVVDATKLGYNVNLITDATRGIDLDDSVEAAFKEMEESGARFLTSEELSESEVVG